MKFTDYVETTCRESSIHGLPYLVRKDLHWTERIFWGAILVSAMYFSISICLNQWNRFVNNPIVYAVELVWGKSDFPYAGITLCSDFYNEEDNVELIEKTWNITPNDSKFQYYWNFLGVLNVLRFDTLHTLKPFANDTTLEKLNYLELLLAVQKRLLPPRSYANESQTMVTTNKPPSYYLENRQLVYAASINEAGLCRTTSQLSKYTNPYGELKYLTVSDTMHCTSVGECNSKIFPKANENTKFRIHLHNVHDVVTPNDRSTIMREARSDGSLIIEIQLSWTKSDDEVRQLPIAYRKCRYPDENNLKYFDLYRPGVCRMECHINAALEMCRCKPYFYAAAPNVRICSIRGMLCLDRKNWSKTRCDCMPLCDEISYTSTQSTEQTDDSAKFEKTFIVKLTLPRMALKRRVVFSTDQLIVSFGGAVGIFLGASFISVYGLIYLFLEYVCINCKSACQRRRRKRIAVRIIKAV